MPSESGQELEEKKASPDQSRRKYWGRRLLYDLSVMDPQQVASHWGEKIAALEEQRYKDPLTKLMILEGVRHQLGKEIARSTREKAPLAVVMLDLDGFKQVNDTHGHQEGDRLIQAVAKYLQNNTRQSDTCGRYAGDEFIVICPKTGQEGALTLGEKLKKGLLDTTRELGFQVTSSLGITIMTGDNPKKVPQLIHEADKALRMAKNKGKNRVEIHASLN